MINNKIIVCHSRDVFVRQQFYLGDFVRCTETVKEMQERNAAFKRGRI